MDAIQKQYEKLKRITSKHDPDGDADALDTAILEMAEKNGNFNFLLESPQEVVFRAKNRACDERRRRKRLKVQPTSLAYTEARKNESLDRDLIREETNRTIHSALQILPDSDQQIVEIRFLDECEPKEIAAVFGIPLSTVYTKSRRAISQLRTAPQLKSWRN